MLSDVTFPPHEPHPSVIDGGRSVENPIAPCVVGELMITRAAGICSPYLMAAARSCVCIPAVWPIPPNCRISWQRLAPASTPSATKNAKVGDNFSTDHG